MVLRTEYIRSTRSQLAEYVRMGTPAPSSVLDRIYLIPYLATGKVEHATAAQEGLPYTT